MALFDSISPTPSNFINGGRKLPVKRRSPGRNDPHSEWVCDPMKRRRSDLRLLFQSFPLGDLSEKKAEPAGHLENYKTAKKGNTYVGATLVTLQLIHPGE